MNVRDLIKELLEFNLDATVNIRSIYDDSESINLSWISNDSNCMSIVDEKLNTNHVFLESDSLDCGYYD